MEGDGGREVEGWMDGWMEGGRERERGGRRDEGWEGGLEGRREERRRGGEEEEQGGRGDQSEGIWTNKSIPFCCRMEILGQVHQLYEVFLKVPRRLYQFLHLTRRAQVDADGRTDGRTH